MLKEKEDNNLQFMIQKINTALKRLNNIIGDFLDVIKAVSESHQGMGIGLNLSAEIINRHSGKIWVESERDKGSSFYFTIPVGK